MITTICITLLYNSITNILQCNYDYIAFRFVMLYVMCTVCTYIHTHIMDLSHVQYVCTHVCMYGARHKSFVYI